MDMQQKSLVTFETILGRCAVAWSDVGITGVFLPQPTGRSLAPTVGADDVPAFVRHAVDGMTAVLAGARLDLRDISLDERGIDEFRRAVYRATRTIPPGTTRTYGEIAQAIGRPLDARDVGAALGRNPFPIVVPCHRVVAANGALKGFSAPGGIATKRRMLELEGVPGYGQLRLFG
jgi:methylated-DNA-[protein]-cysteine S-methyltransferase